MEHIDPPEPGQPPGQQQVILQNGAEDEGDHERHARPVMLGQVVADDAERCRQHEIETRCRDRRRAASTASASITGPADRSGSPSAGPEARRRRGPAATSASWTGTAPRSARTPAAAGCSSMARPGARPCTDRAASRSTVPSLPGMPKARVGSSDAAVLGVVRRLGRHHAADVAVAEAAAAAWPSARRDRRRRSSPPCRRLPGSCRSAEPISEQRSSSPGCRRTASTPARMLPPSRRHRTLRQRWFARRQPPDA